MGLLLYVEPSDPVAATAGQKQGGKDFNQCGLPSTVWSEQTKKFTFGGKVHIILSRFLPYGVQPLHKDHRANLDALDPYGKMLLAYLRAGVASRLSVILPGLIDFLMAIAIRCVVVYHPDGLHKRVANSRANETEEALLQVYAHRNGLGGGSRIVFERF